MPPMTDSTAKEARKSTIAIAAAVVLSAGYLCFAGYLFVKFVLGDGGGTNWDRAVVLFNAVSAIGFSAFGVLLGTTVQQVNLVNAKKETDKAKASENTLAERGKELIAAAQEQLSHTAKVKDHGISVTNQNNLWAGHVGNERQLREAVGRMQEAIAARS
jgi:hypothetical protein